MPQKTAPPTRLLRPADMCELFGIGKTTLWRWTRETPGFPQPVRLGDRISAWRVEEVEAWIDSRPAA